MICAHSKSWTDHPQKVDEQSAIPQLRFQDSITKLSRFQNQTPRFHNQSRHASTTIFARFHNNDPAIPQPTTKDSTTKPSRFHNQTDAIPQPKPHDVTNKISGFHNHTTSIPQPQCCNSFHPTPLVSAYKVFTSMISERPHPLGQCAQSLHIHDDPTPWAGAYTVFTSITSQRSHPLGQCVQRLHIHDILKIAPRWSGLTQSSHP